MGWPHVTHAHVEGCGNGADYFLHNESGIPQDGFLVLTVSQATSGVWPCSAAIKSDLFCLPTFFCLFKYFSNFDLVYKGGL